MPTGHIYNVGQQMIIVLFCFEPIIPTSLNQYQLEILFILFLVARLVRKISIRIEECYEMSSMWSVFGLRKLLTALHLWYTFKYVTVNVLQHSLM